MLCGCGVFTSVLKIHPDGSGTIVQTTKLNAMATQFMRSMATAGDSTSRPADSTASRLFTKKQVRARATQFGEGVRFVRMERLREGGYRAVYAFDDVRTVRLTPELQMDPGNDGPGEKASGDTSNTAGQMRMARMMLQDAKMGVAVEPQGTLVETNAAHRSEKGRVTLMELNFSEEPRPSGRGF